VANLDAGQREFGLKRGSDCKNDLLVSQMQRHGTGFGR